MPQKLVCLETKASDKRRRTADVLIRENVNFAGLMLRDDVLTGLKNNGFKRPSPIQLKAIPLGRCGLDLIIQAKSGTGKTCVFAVIALESICLDSGAIQVLVLAPTREIAVQLWEVFNALGSAMKSLLCHTFIGGLPLSEDIQKLQRCHIAVGTPGRVKQLIEERIMDTSTIRLFVLDEADKLLEENFQDSVNWIYSTLPETKQMIAASATYPETLAQHLRRYMTNPTFVRLNITDPALLGIRQYYEAAAYNPQKAFDNKIKQLTRLLSSVNFNQCLVFSNYQMRAQSLSDTLNAQGWPATFISGSRDQQDRLAAMAQLKKLQCRILVSTDLTARGIDADHVNLVVNLDLPHDHETYLHRVGRAGRFGTYGAAVSFVCVGQELDGLRAIADKCGTKILQLPDPIPIDLAKSSGFVYTDDLVTTEQIVTDESKTCDTTNGHDNVTKINQTATSTSACSNSTKSCVGVSDKFRDIVRFGRRSTGKGSITYEEASADFEHYMNATDTDETQPKLMCDERDTGPDIPFQELVDHVSTLLGTLTHSVDDESVTATACPARPVDSGIALSEPVVDIEEVGSSVDGLTPDEIATFCVDASALPVYHRNGVDDVNGDDYITPTADSHKSETVLSTSDDQLSDADVQFCIGCKKRYVSLPDGLTSLDCQPEIGLFTCNECAESDPIGSQRFAYDVDDRLGAEYAQQTFVEYPSDTDCDLEDMYQSTSSEPMECVKQQGNCHSSQCDDISCKCRSSGTQLDFPRGHRVPAASRIQTGDKHPGRVDVMPTKQSYYLKEVRPLNRSRRRTTNSAAVNSHSKWSPLSNYADDSETWSDPYSESPGAEDNMKFRSESHSAASYQEYADVYYQNYVYHLQCSQYYKAAWRQMERSDRMTQIYASQKHYIEQMGKFAARRKQNGR